MVAISVYVLSTTTANPVFYIYLALMSLSQTTTSYCTLKISNHVITHTWQIIVVAYGVNHKTGGHFVIRQEGNKNKVDIIEIITVLLIKSYRPSTVFLANTNLEKTRHTSSEILAKYWRSIYCRSQSNSICADSNIYS